MKFKRISTLVLFLFAISISQKIVAQNLENWTKDQLMQPADLVKKMRENKDLPVIFSVGPGAYILHSIDIGMVKEKENLDKLKKEVKALAKDRNIVVYCGCCPFDRCPNIRPAIQALKDLKFTNYQLLNLEHNIKIDWIGKGYPVAR
jgi:thiosulfate/3-mercaptopyruvate sulfurtransferase